MKKTRTLRLILGLNIVLGLVLLIDGIVTGIHGATVIGLIVAAVYAQQMLNWNIKEENGDENHQLKLYDAIKITPDLLQS
jgi:hypothetical protein